MRKLSNTWEQQTLLEGGDLQEHVSQLTNAIEQRLQRGENVLISGAQAGELPSQPVRGTPFKKLMIAVLPSSRLTGMQCMRSQALGSQLLSFGSARALDKATEGIHCSSAEEL